MVDSMAVWLDYKVVVMKVVEMVELLVDWMVVVLVEL